MVMNYFREKKLFFILFYYKEMVLDYFQEEKKNQILSLKIFYMSDMCQILLHLIYIYIYLLVNLYLFKW